jgi:hypothetical protein
MACLYIAKPFPKMQLLMTCLHGMNGHHNISAAQPGCCVKTSTTFYFLTLGMPISDFRSKSDFPGSRGVLRPEP